MLAARVQSLLSPLNVAANQDWGLDHGTWSVLAHLFPKADIPVVQLSIDATQSNEFHFQLGNRLAALRDEGVLIFGSGNLVHNLRVVRWTDNAPPYPWASRIEQELKNRLAQNDHQTLVDYKSLDPDILLAVPTPEHYLPLLHVIGAQRPDDEIRFPLEGIDLGSIGMLSVSIG